MPRNGSSVNGGRNGVDGSTGTKDTRHRDALKSASGLGSEEFKKAYQATWDSSQGYDDIDDVTLEEQVVYDASFGEISSDLLRDFQRFAKDPDHYPTHPSIGVAPLKGKGVSVYAFMGSHVGDDRNVYQTFGDFQLAQKRKPGLNLIARAGDALTLEELADLADMKFFDKETGELAYSGLVAAREGAQKDPRYQALKTQKKLMRQQDEGEFLMDFLRRNYEIQTSDELLNGWEKNLITLVIQYFRKPTTEESQRPGCSEKLLETHCYLFYQGDLDLRQEGLRDLIRNTKVYGESNVRAAQPRHWGVTIKPEIKLQLGYDPDQRASNAELNGYERKQDTTDDPNTRMQRVLFRSECGRHSLDNGQLSLLAESGRLEHTRDKTTIITYTSAQYVTHLIASREIAAGNCKTADALVDRLKTYETPKKLTPDEVALEAKLALVTKTNQRVEYIPSSDIQQQEIFRELATNYGIDGDYISHIEGPSAHKDIVKGMASSPIRFKVVHGQGRTYIEAESEIHMNNLKLIGNSIYQLATKVGYSGPDSIDCLNDILIEKPSEALRAFGKLMANNVNYVKLALMIHEYKDMFDYRLAEPVQKK